jgi:hypothetical protein
MWEIYLGMRERGELALKAVPAPPTKKDVGLFEYRATGATGICSFQR